jgi:DNA-binding beta-propeller fold protein YncE
MYPCGVAVDHDGNIYVADTYNHRIQKLNEHGGFVASWGG